MNDQHSYTNNKQRWEKIHNDSIEQREEHDFTWTVGDEKSFGNKVFLILSLATENKTTISELIDKKITSITYESWTLMGLMCYEA